jgi:hypothetical protein
MINEQTQTLILSVFNAANASTKRAVKNAISKEIKTGGIFSKFKDVDEVLLTLNARRLSTTQKNFVFKTIFKNTTDPKLLEDYSKQLFKSKPWMNKYSQLSERAFKQELKSKGFSDDQVDVIVQTWKKEGYSFGRSTKPKPTNNRRKSSERSINTTSYEKFMDEFNDFRKNALPDDPFWIVPKNVMSGNFLKPFKGFNITSLKRLAMWLSSGQRTLPSELLLMFKRNGVVGIAGGVSGTIVRSYLRMWFAGFMIVLAKKIWKEHHNDFAEREMGPEVAMWLLSSVVESVPFLKYVIPWDIMKFMINNIWILMKGVGTGGPVWNELKELWGIPSSEEIMNRVIPEEYQDLMNVVTEKQYEHIRYNKSTNSLYWETPECPIKKINGEWLVLVPNDGWYSIKDIE